MKLLLDEHLSPKVAEIVQGLAPGTDIESIYQWKEGQFISQPDERILRAASEEERVLVTFDVRSIPPLLVEFGMANEDHGGVIFVSVKSFPSHDFKGLAHALVTIIEQDGDKDWDNRVTFLGRA